jgi:hypothetical protein
MTGRLTATLIVAAVAWVVLGLASPAWAPACAPFALDIKDSTRVWVGTIVAVDDASSKFPGPTIARPVFGLHVQVQEVLKGSPVPDVELVYTNTFAPMSRSALLGWQTVFALPARQADGTQWGRLDCQIGTGVGELRQAAASALGVTLPTPLPPPAPVQGRIPWFVTPVGAIIVAALALAALVSWRRRARPAAATRE